MKCSVLKVCTVLLIFGSQYSWASNLYDVLGVPRDATTQEIKKAYKKAARIWHPDKNKDPGANEKFMKINEAYETLSDDKRRQEYDTFGRTSSDNTPSRNGHPFGGGSFDPFEAFFGNFRRNTREEEHSPAFESISYRQFKLEVLPQSEKQPFLIYGYGDYCFPCMRMNGVWRRSGEELIPLGIGMRVFNVEYDGHLRDELRIHYVPSIAAVIDGQVRYFRGSEMSPAALRQFLRDVFPSGLYDEITDDNWLQFSRSWTDNKARFLMVSPSRLLLPPLRFFLSAFRFRENMIAGWTTPKMAPKLMEKFGVSTLHDEDRETLLVFHEDDKRPVASLSSHSLKSEVMWEVLNENLLLDLPRLSSPVMLDHLCPPEIRPHRKHLCVLLVSERGQERSEEMNSFRDYARKLPRSEYGTRVRLGYIYERVQIAFLNGLNAPRDNAMNHIVIIWRKTSRQLAYRWLRLPWNASDRGTSKAILEETIHSALYGTGVLADEVILSQLYDEHGASLIVRMWRRGLLWVKYAIDFTYTFDPTMVATTLFVGGITVLMCISMWVAAKREEAMYKKTAASRQRRAPQPHETAGRRPDNRPVINELRAKTYGELVTGSRQGYMTFVLLLTDETKGKLLTDYVQCILPFTRISKMVFAFTMLETHATWFKHLLSYTIDKPGLAQTNLINVKNCAGTVLAINGYRKYFCIYHPKIKSALLTRRGRRNDDDDFLGLDESSTDSYSSDDEERAGGPVTGLDTLQDPNSKLFHRDLLYGLPNWLDRVFDGAVPRIRVDSWPTMSVTEEVAFQNYGR